MSVNSSTAAELNLTIDGQLVTCAPGTTILEAARAQGIAIPSLCAHPELKPFGGCRLCIVEIDGVAGYPSACTFPCRAGAVVRTTSPAVDHLRRNTLALLLSKHPTGCLMCGHDDDCLEHHGCHARRSGAVTGCRFCPQDQQCEFQSLVELLGLKELPFPVEYRGRVVDKRNPFFDFDPNLCILCGRCTRACDELRGAQAIALVQRGEHTTVGTLGDEPRIETSCQLCGTCIDVCPTGALAERVNKWVGVADGQVVTTCSYCSLGCPLELHTLDGQVIGSAPVDGQPLCSKGRFAPVELALADNRVVEPHVRHQGRLVPVEWDEALAAVERGLAGRPLSVWASRDLPQADLEALAALPGDPAGDTPWRAGFSATADLPAVAAADLIVTVHTDLRYSHTPALLAMRTAVDAGATLLAIEPFASDPQRLAAWTISPAVGELADTVAALTAVARGETVSDDWAAAVAPLLAASRPVIVWGGALLDTAQAAATLAALEALAGALGARTLPLLAGANSHAAWALGFCGAPLTGPERGLLSVGRPPGDERPEVGCWVACTPYLDDLTTQADVVLPLTVSSEQTGVLRDVGGAPRPLRAALPPTGDCHDAAWVAALIGPLLGPRAAAGVSASSPEAAEERQQPGNRTSTGPSPDLGRGAGGSLVVQLVRESSAFTYLGQPLAALAPGFIPLAREGRLQLHPDDAEPLGGEGATVTITAGSEVLTARLWLTPAVPRGAGRLVTAGSGPPAPQLGPNPGPVVVRAGQEG